MVGLPLEDPTPPQHFPQNRSPLFLPRTEEFGSLPQAMESYIVYLEVCGHVCACVYVFVSGRK